MKLVNSEQFNEEIKTGITVAKFFATWCGPCKIQTPIVEQIEAEMKEKANFIEIDIDQSPDVTKAYEIMGVPTIIIFKNGQKVDQIVGFINGGTTDKPVLTSSYYSTTLIIKELQRIGFIMRLSLQLFFVSVERSE